MEQQRLMQENLRAFTCSVEINTAAPEEGGCFTVSDPESWYFDKHC